MTPRIEPNLDLVSIVVPTLNAASVIDACLGSITAQTYDNIELIIVDGYSCDDTVVRARSYTDNVFLFGSSQGGKGGFSAPSQRNYGAANAHGSYIYWADADMVLPATLIENCVRQARSIGADALIIPERSIGTGFWAEVKAMERECYVGDDLVEAPRFVSAGAWRALDGLDVNMGGNDDWDLHNRLKAGGWIIGRLSQEVLHNEGHLRLSRLARKRFIYGRYIPHFLGRYGMRQSIRHYNPFRRYIARRRILAQRPRHLIGLLVMRLIEYGAGGAGLLLGFVSPHGKVDHPAMLPTPTASSSPRPKDE
jgi:glycosyltransferase involved in cell wall biosynthesis